MTQSWIQKSSFLTAKILALLHTVYILCVPQPFYIWNRCPTIHYSHTVSDPQPFYIWKRCPTTHYSHTVSVPQPFYIWKRCPTTHYSHTVSDPQPFWAEAAAPAHGDFMLVLCLRLLSSTAQTVPPTHTWMPFVPFLCCSPVLHLIHLTKRKIYIYIYI